MSDKYTVGTCGNCGGPVEQYRSLCIVGPFPPAQCANCGAIPQNPHGPRIPMQGTPQPAQPISAVQGGTFTWKAGRSTC